MDLHIGVDEVGYGAIAGPLLVCGVVPRFPFPDFKDSKKYDEAARVKVYPDAIVAAKDYEIRWADNLAVDEIGLRNVWHDLVAQVIEALRFRNGYLHAIVDGGVQPRRVPYCTALVKGDTLDTVIAAASIIAKVTRDGLMEELDEFFPGYDMARHKGYGTPEHFDAVRRLGATSIHRNLFLRKMRASQQAPA